MCSKHSVKIKFLKEEYKIYKLPTLKRKQQKYFNYLKFWNDEIKRSLTFTIIVYYLKYYTINFRLLKKNYIDFWDQCIFKIQ